MVQQAMKLSRAELHHLDMGPMNWLKTFETVQAAAVHRDRPTHHAVSALVLSFVLTGFAPSRLAQTAHHNNVELP
jgi:hypothetical protein